MKLIQILNYWFENVTNLKFLEMLRLDLILKWLKVYYSVLSSRHTYIFKAALETENKMGTLKSICVSINIGPVCRRKNKYQCAFMQYFLPLSVKQCKLLWLVNHCIKIAFSFPFIYMLIFLCVNVLFCSS